MSKTCNGCCNLKADEENSLAMDMIKDYKKKLKARSILCLTIFIMWIVSVCILSLHITKRNGDCDENTIEYTTVSIDTKTARKTNNNTQDKQRKRKADTVKLRLVARDKVI